MFLQNKHGATTQITIYTHIAVKTSNPTYLRMAVICYQTVNMIWGSSCNTEKKQTLVEAAADPEHSASWYV